MNDEEISKKAHRFLMDEGVMSIRETYPIIQVRIWLIKFLKENLEPEPELEVDLENKIIKFKKKEGLK